MQTPLLLSVVVVAALIAPACGGVRPTRPTVPNSVIKRVEQRPLPPDPATEPLPDGVPKVEWVRPLERGECEKAPKPCPAVSGLAISEARAFRDAKYRIRYKELRSNYGADRQVWGAHRELYETRLGLADQTIQDLQPRWWDRNKFQIGVVGGVILGIITSVAILAVTEEVRK